MKSIKDFNVKGKRILVRCDFNVPINERGVILDDFRIKKAVPTIQYLLSNKAKVILLSHLGRPDGAAVKSLRLDNVKKALENFLKTPISKSDDCVGKKVEKQVLSLQSGQVLLLENLRFHKGEQANDLGFAKELSALGEIYINDAFSDCHRSDASIASVSKFLPHGAGLLLQSEVENLSKILKNPVKPFVALVGGLKVQTKANFIDEISEIANVILVSGPIQKEIAEENIKIPYPEKIIGPSGSLIAPDINDRTIKVFTEKIMSAKTIVWNGPFGRFEEKKYEKGTLAIADAIVKSGAFSVVGGGETVEFLNKKGMIDKFSHVSTGGGAMLAYLAGEELPGLKALE